FDLYCQLVTEAVAELTGGDVRHPEEPAEIRVDLPLDAHLPASYIEKDDLRLAAYRRLADTRSPEEVDDVATEWSDRYGPLPPPATALLDAARIRARARQLGLQELVVVRGMAKISPVVLPASRQIRLERVHPKAKYKPDLRELVIPVPSEREPLLSFLTEVLDSIVA